jgi:hypothetical protein
VQTPERWTLFPSFRTRGTDAPVLRVGVVVDQPCRAPWITAFLRFLRELDGLDVCVLPLDAGTTASRPQLPWLVDRLYALSRTKSDPFGDFVLPSPRSLPIDDLTRSTCDLLIWLASSVDPDARLSGIAPYGVVSIRLGEDQSPLPFWADTLNARTTTAVTVYWHETSLVRGRPVADAELAMLGSLYVTLNAKEPLVAAMRLLADLCMHFRLDGPATRARLQMIPEGSISLESRQRLSNRDALRFLSRKLARSARGRYLQKKRHSSWFVATRPNVGRSISDLRGFKAVPQPPNTVDMADPFLYEHGDREFLLFEHTAPESPHGKIAFVELLRDGGTSDMRVLLEAPHHLSYPCVVDVNGDKFLLPESAAARRVDLYRLSDFPDRVEYVGPLIENVALVDTTPVEIDGLWYFFATTEQPFLQTFLFWSPRLDGMWRLHPCNPISNSITNTRSAGHLFWRDGRLFRPTQDCSVRYGYAIRVNEIVKLTPDDFEERPVAWLGPSWYSSGLLGTHTWNESRRFQVIDGLRVM